MQYQRDFTMYQQQLDFNNKERIDKEFWVLKKSYATIINI